MSVNVSKKGAAKADTQEVVLATSTRHRHNGVTFKAGVVYVLPEDAAEELLSLEHKGEPFFINSNKVKHAGLPRVALTSTEVAVEEDLTSDVGGDAADKGAPADAGADAGAPAGADAGAGVQII